MIEVGIDVANATVMLVEGAERYGLSQLHQLRGRVGRGEHASHCILFADAGSELAHRRLAAIEAERDGFKLAEVDLALRGEGEILGTRQHGLPRFRVAELPEDVAMLTEARRELIELLDRYGSLDAPELGPLLQAARERFGDERAEPSAAWASQMRVVAGELKGRRLAAPPRRSAAVRPTADRVREALFAILGDVGGASVLDLFCGTGALGIEALSRGADRATLVDTRRLARPAQRARARPGAPCGGRPLRRPALSATLPPALRPDLLRPAL